MTERKVYEIKHVDNRGIATLVGLVVVAILTRMWLTNSLPDLFLAMYSPTGEGLGSASYVIINFVANIVYGIGTAIVLVSSGLWWVITDVASGIRQIMRERSAKQEIGEAVATQAVTEDIQQQPPADNPIVIALQTMNENIETTFNSVQQIGEKVESLDARITMIEDGATKTTTRRTTKS